MPIWCFTNSNSDWRLYTNKIIGVGEEVISEFEARGGKMTTLTGAEKVKFDNLMTEKVLPAMMDKFDADALKAAEIFTSN